MTALHGDGESKVWLLCSGVVFITVNSISFKFQTVFFTSLCIIFVYNMRLGTELLKKKKNFLTQVS